LAFKLFKKFFLDQYIPITWFHEYKKIKDSYYGGAVDVYRPHGRNLYYYDVNSLYPFVMQNNLYPTGSCSYFRGARPLSTIFGIVRCKVTTPTMGGLQGSSSLRAGVDYVPLLLTKTIRAILPPGGELGISDSLAAVEDSAKLMSGNGKVIAPLGS